MSLEEVIARLESQVTVLKKVGGSAELSAVANQIKQLPIAFVLPGTESASPNGYATGETLQRVTLQFGVVSVVRNVKDATGRAGMSDLQSVRQAIKAALIGYSPSACEPIEFRSGRVLRFDADAVLWWLDEFSTVFYEVSQ